MKDYRPLTVQAHELLEPLIHSGDRVIDATAGNGHDTEYLARRVGTEGAVMAFDIQPDALQNTRQRLQQAGLLRQVSLCLMGHQYLQQQLPSDWHGEVAAVLFNLGYLPGGDHATVTAPDSTLIALEQAMQCLRTGGALSVLAYRGHPGGQSEAEAVGAWFAAQDRYLTVQQLESPGPVLFHAQRK